jgi:hypothetical protein
MLPSPPTMMGEPLEELDPLDELDPAGELPAALVAEVVPLELDLLLLLQAVTNRASVPAAATAA